MKLEEVNIDDTLIANFLAGELSQEDAVLFREKMENSSEFREAFHAARRIWGASLLMPSNNASIADTEKALGKFLNNTVRPQVERKSVIKQWHYWTTGVAASFLLGILVYTFVTNRKTEVATLGDKLIGYVLPDSSIVDLNKNSKLSYNPKYGSSRREVTLSGEAFFSVIKNTERPFIVHVKDVSIRVVGTSFNVKEENGKVKVSVKTGKVLVYFERSPEKRLLLQPNQKGILDPQIQTIIKTQQSTVNCSSWKTGTLTFDKTPLSGVLSELTDIFNTKINCADTSLNNLLISASFSNQTLDQIIDILSYSDNLTVEKTKDGIILKRE